MATMELDAGLDGGSSMEFSDSDGEDERVVDAHRGQYQQRLQARRHR